LQREHTPGLNIQCDDRLGSGLYLASLLLVVLSKTLGLEPLVLRILLLVAAAEKINLIILLLSSSGCLSGVEGELSGLRAVSSVVLGGVTGKGGELRLPGEDVVVPSPGVGVLLGCGDGLDLLEDLDIGLGRGVAVPLLETQSRRI
jgi:hypothetical protein